MLDSNYRNKSCGFGEEVVAYLYDEIGKNEKIRFESHLAICKNCEEEVNSFGVLRNSISEWRVTDFESLSLPEVKINFEDNKKTISSISTNSKSWFAGISRIFSISPPWATATAGFAVLVVCAVITFFAFNFVGENELSKINEKPTLNQPKTEEKVVQPEKNDLVENNSLEQKKSDTFKIEGKTNSEYVKETSIKKSPVKQKENIKKQILAKKDTKQQKNTNQKQVIKRPDDEIMANFDEKQVPKLSNFSEGTENETDSISLADLFDEVGDDK
jgi:hypothetical protein